MKAATCICALSLCCWGLAVILYTQMSAGVWAILGAGLCMWLGATTAVMGIACAIVDLTRGMDGEAEEATQTD